MLFADSEPNVIVDQEPTEIIRLQPVIEVAW
jgi:hypothetical protein